MQDQTMTDSTMREPFMPIAEVNDDTMFNTGDEIVSWGELRKRLVRIPTDPKDREMVELLPCPFCGNTRPEHVGSADGGYVECGSCLATMPEHDPDVPDVNARWNTRSTPTAPAPGDAQLMSAPGVATAWSYELATHLSGTGEYSGWRLKLSRTEPCVPERSIRNLVPLYALAPVPTAPAQSDDRVKALRLARPIVEYDLTSAREYHDADWEGESQAALDAIDAALAPVRTPDTVQGGVQVNQEVASIARLIWRNTQDRDTRMVQENAASLLWLAEHGSLPGWDDLPAAFAALADPSSDITQGEAA